MNWRADRSRVVVDDLGGEIFSGSAFSGEQHCRRRTGGDPLQEGTQRHHRRRVADYARERIGLGA